ncbi:hypothetical protein [Tsukamurella paurometabola]|uniref:Uncharacterized protein n=1 Tax=Tsukamurella paurometabola TaxID=2061 RepID=A0ABS5NI88_TSUPA|nr:hypothetical protein [Tsukamurella paurometabola]MBS4104009.1 hypothetical protein [Tsukamurella paurometabola]
MSNSDPAREDVAQLINEFRSTIARAVVARRPDIVRRAKAQIENLIEKQAAVDAADAKLVEAKEALARAEQALRDLEGSNLESE